MQNTALLENLFLYVGHKVKVCLSDGTILEDELKNYDEEGVFLLTKEVACTTSPPISSKAWGPR